MQSAYIVAVIKYLAGAFAACLCLVGCGATPAAKPAQTAVSKPRSSPSGPPLIKAPAGFDESKDTACFNEPRVRCAEDFDVDSVSRPVVCSRNANICTVVTATIPATVKITSRMLKAHVVMQAYGAPFPDRSWERLTLRWPDGSSAKLSIKIETEWSLITVKSKLVSETGNPRLGTPFSGQFSICDTYNDDAACSA